MICVSIARGRHKQVKAEHRHLVEQGAQMVELRLDYIRREIRLKRLLRDRPCPVIVTCRRLRDQGKWEGTEEARLMLLRAAIAEGVEYVDLEEDVAATVPRYGDTQRIVSLHNFRETPEDLAEIHERLTQLDPDVIKLATMANDPYDNVRMLELIRSSKIPTVGICMGEIGTPSRILAGKYGAPFTFSTFHQERALAPGQLSFGEMVSIYDYDKINAQTEVYGVIADPIGHSLSPVVHNAAFRELHLNKVYVPFRVPREHLSSFLVVCKHLGVRGVSVTIPHKEAILRHLSKVDAACAGIGAVNTVIFDKDGALGYNTDHRSAMSSLTMAISDNSDKNPFDKRVALVLGSGGVSRAIAYGLCQRGAQVVIAARNTERGEELADHLDCRAVEWEQRHGVKPDILINGTPVGMHPDVDQTPFEKDYLRRNMTVFDSVYNPEQTLLIKNARQKECSVITGVDMFVRQAALQFQYFTGDEAPTEIMRSAVKRVIGAAKY